MYQWLFKGSASQATMKPLSQALAFVQRKLIRSADRPASYMSLSNTNGGIYEGAELYAETWIAEKYGPP